MSVQPACERLDWSGLPPQSTHCRGSRLMARCLFPPCQCRSAPTWLVPSRPARLTSAPSRGKGCAPDDEGTFLPRSMNSSRATVVMCRHTSSTTSSPRRSRFAYPSTSSKSPRQAPATSHRALPIPAGRCLQGLSDPLRSSTALAIPHHSAHPPVPAAA